MLIGYDSMQGAAADNDTRTISLHHIHTGEDITVTYKRNGRYDLAALKKLDWFLRDWRRQEAIHMDPMLIDLVWQVSHQVGAEKPIWVVCGYRAPATNSMLRRRSSGVAQNSQHTHGRAMDFYIPDASLSQIRIAGLRLQRGGVGYYPTSGSPFVHLDTSSVRMWPRMSREELARVFPDGRTVHIPSDGRPLRGYALALADIERRGGSPSIGSLEAAHSAGIATDATPKRSLLASLFGGKDEDDEVTATSAVGKPVAVERVNVKRDQVAALAAKPEAVRPSPAALPAPRHVAESAPLSVKLAAVPMPPTRPARPARPASLVVAADESSPAGMIAARGTWDGTDGLKQLENIGSLKVAAATRSIAIEQPIQAVMAYAPSFERPSPANSSALTRRPAKAGQPSVATIRPTVVASTQTFDDIWLRAVMLAPDLQNFLSTTIIGRPNFKELTQLMRKPGSALAMSFSDDPLGGIASDHFSGDAIVFLGTVSFITHTAFLQ